MYEITVKWPHGLVGTEKVDDRAEADRWADFLRTVGADDVKIRCICGECETCSDYAVWESM